MKTKIVRERKCTLGALRASAVSCFIRSYNVNLNIDLTKNYFRRLGVEGKCIYVSLCVCVMCREKINLYLSLKQVIRKCYKF